MNSRNFHSNSQDRRARTLPNRKAAKSTFYCGFRGRVARAVASFKASLLHMAQLGEIADWPRVRQEWVSC